MSRGARTSRVVAVEGPDVDEPEEDDEDTVRAPALFSGGAARRRLLGGHHTTEPLGVRLATDAVRLGVLDGRRVALDTNTKGKGQVEPFLIREA